MQVARQALGYLDLHFQLRQIDDGQERRILGHARPLGDLDLADTASHRRLHLQGSDLAVQIGHDQLLAIKERLLAADIELGLLRRRCVIRLRLPKREISLLQVILGFERLQFGKRPEFKRLGATIRLALRRSAIDPSASRGTKALSFRSARGFSFIGSS